VEVISPGHLGKKTNKSAQVSAVSVKKSKRGDVSFTRVLQEEVGGGLWSNENKEEALTQNPSTEIRRGRSERTRLDNLKSSNRGGLPGGSAKIGKNEVTREVVQSVGGGGETKGTRSELSSLSFVGGRTIKWRRAGWGRGSDAKKKCQTISRGPKKKTRAAKGGTFGKPNNPAKVRMKEPTKKNHKEMNCANQGRPKLRYHQNKKKGTDYNRLTDWKKGRGRPVRSSRGKASPGQSTNLTAKSVD